MEEPPDTPPSGRLWALPAGELVGVFDEAMAAINHHTVVALRALREIEGRAIPARSGAVSTMVWVRNRHRVTPGTARRMVKAATALAAAPSALQDAADAGEVNLDQLEAITTAVDNLPQDLGRDVRESAAKELARLAATLDPFQLSRAGERILQLVAPEVADEAERQALERAEARALRDRHVTLTRDHAGTGYRLTGRLTNEAAAVFRAAIEPLCAPATSRSGPAAGSALGLAPEPVPADNRTAGQRRADALIEICRLALNTTKLPRNGGDRPQVVVNVKYDVLKQELGEGTLDNGDRVTPETARRMACDSRLLPIVLDGAGLPLDVGRTRRLVNGALRQALIVRDRGCAFPGCDRGPRWTDGHHVVPWSEGGETSLGNTVLLCGHHHRELHKPDGWAVYIAPDGLPTFSPPPHVDPGRRPQRNRFHRRP